MNYETKKEIRTDVIDYKKLYFSLFNKISDLIKELETQNITQVESCINKLKDIQIKAEEMYMDM